MTNEAPDYSDQPQVKEKKLSRYQQQLRDRTERDRASAHKHVKEKHPDYSNSPDGTKIEFDYKTPSMQDKLDSNQQDTQLDGSPSPNEHISSTELAKINNQQAISDLAGKIQGVSGTQVQKVALIKPLIENTLGQLTDLDGNGVLSVLNSGLTNHIPQIMSNYSAIIAAISQLKDKKS